MENIEITEPTELEITLESVTNAKCSGNLDGAIDISVSGGTMPYSFMWSNGEISEDLVDLAAGFYSVTVTDANGCTDTLENIEVETPSTLEVVLESTTNVTCFGETDGAIDVTVSGGTMPYSFLWSSGAMTEDISGISAGSYSVTVTDANNCSFSLNDIEISEPSELEATLDSTSNVSCNGDSDGSIDISVTGGTPGYTYLWSNDATTQDISGLAAGIYSVTITDANGCTDTLENIEISERDVLDADLASEDVSCVNNGGSITISNPSGGSGEYEYSIDGGTSWQMSGIYNSLSGGFYNVQIRDKNNSDCLIVLSDNLEIVDPGFPDGGLVVKDVTCFGGSDGSITVTVSGGVAPYKVNGNEVDETNIYILSGLTAGLYGVTIEDSNGCALAIDDIEVEEPLLLDPPTFETTQADCLGGNGGVVFTNLPSGQDLYYSINNGPFTLYDGSISLPAADYIFVVRFGFDGCVSDEFPISIGRPQAVDVILETSSVDPNCETLLGSIAVANPQDLLFTVTNQSTSMIYYNEVSYPVGGFINLPAGTYLVLGSSSDGCRLGSKLVDLIEPICDNFEGCTLGYWKNHTDRWTCYSTCTLYGSVFTNAPSQLSGLTLLEVLNLGGGGINNLGRQSVAALLNTCHADVNYEILSTEELIAYVMANFDNAGAAGSYLDNLNNAGCTLGGSSATTAPSTTCPSTGDTKPGKGKPGKNSDAAFTASFSAYPVPFRETLNIKYEFDYRSDVSIQFFDMQGRLLSTYKAKKVSKGDVTNLSLDFTTRASQVYIVKVNTDREVFTKNIISDK